MNLEVDLGAPFQCSPEMLSFEDSSKTDNGDGEVVVSNSSGSMPLRPLGSPSKQPNSKNKGKHVRLSPSKENHGKGHSSHTRAVVSHQKKRPLSTIHEAPTFSMIYFREKYAKVPLALTTLENLQLAAGNHVCHRGSGIGWSQPVNETPLADYHGFADIEFSSIHPFLFHKYTRELPKLNQTFELKLKKTPKEHVRHFGIWCIALMDLDVNKKTCYGWVSQSCELKFFTLFMQMMIQWTYRGPHYPGYKVAGQLLSIEATGEAHTHGGIDGFNAGPTVAGLPGGESRRTLIKVGPQAYVGKNQFLGVVSWKIISEDPEIDDIVAS